MIEVNPDRAASQELPASLPKCQYCGTDPAPIIPAFFSHAGARCIVFHCGMCRAVFTTSVLSFGETAPQAEPSRILRPQ